MDKMQMINNVRQLRINDIIVQFCTPFLQYLQNILTRKRKKKGKEENCTIFTLSRAISKKKKNEIKTIKGTQIDVFWQNNNF